MECKTMIQLNSATTPGGFRDPHAFRPSVAHLPGIPMAQLARQNHLLAALPEAEWQRWLPQLDLSTCRSGSRNTSPESP